MVRPMLRGSLYNKVLFLVLAGAVVGFLARTKTHAAPPLPVVIQSKPGEGFWKEVNFNGYEGCASPNAAYCELRIYADIVGGGWTTTVFVEDSSWGVKNFSVYDSGWDLPNWACSPPFSSNETEMINVVEGFGSINGLTGLYRKEFYLDILEGFVIKDATLKMLSDNKTAVYINGDLLVSNKEGCYSVDMAQDKAQRLFIEGVGMNVLAVQLSNDGASPTNNPMGLGYELTINYDEAPPPSNRNNFGAGVE